MEQLLHGRATTTPYIRQKIQASNISIAKLAAHYNINPNTVIKWKNRNHVNDKPSRPKNPCSTILTPVQEAAIEAFRNHTLLPLDD